MGIFWWGKPCTSWVRARGGPHVYRSSYKAENKKLCWSATAWDGWKDLDPGRTARRKLNYARDQPALWVSAALVGWSSGLRGAPTCSIWGRNTPLVLEQQGLYAFVIWLMDWSGPGSGYVDWFPFLDPDFTTYSWSNKIDNLLTLTTRGYMFGLLLPAPKPPNKLQFSLCGR